ncbi:MAG: LysM peptidoglycan-binding domain-containing protein [Parvularculaceae bacterium]|jgi:LysM repeat protein|nr:LysM peptidoglycan-binding domain-containing protein [Parvularculaceae bacterium]
MKSKLLGMTALAAVVAAPMAALGADQATATPAAAAPQKPSIEEELVYLRDIIALQTLRLDEAEQALARQTKLLEDQQKKIAMLEGALKGAIASIDARGATLAAADMSGGYVVKSGDTLGALATRFSVSVADLAAANNLRAPYALRVGQRLAVPGAAPAAPAGAAMAQNEVPAKDGAPAVKVAAATPPGPSPESRPDVTDRAVKQQRADNVEKTGTPQEVGVRPANEDDRPEVAVLNDVGGILTPKGALYAEPSFDYTVTSDNRFFFQGIEIVDAILIGAIEATDSDRRARTAGLGLRYGVTDRLEIDARGTWVNRNDRISGIAIDDGSSVFRELNGGGLGDAEVGIHYQLTGGRNFPFTVLNLRAKAPTGEGPFEVDRDSRGLELELPSGSGFWTIEPSATFILPSDPAVVFANIGYQMNMTTRPDTVFDDFYIREVSPGDAIRASIGVGLAVNDRFSFSFGYDQSAFFSTRTVLESIGTPGAFVETSQQPSMVGSFLFGGSYTLNDRIRLNLNTSFGATDEAPDMRVSLRAQVRLFD